MPEHADKSDLLKTAIHEAGHAVAHIRYRLDYDYVTIRCGESTLGHVTGEGVENVWDRDNALEQAIAYCAGYAAMRNAGLSDKAARLGCDDDFEHAEHLIKFWKLEPLEFILTQAINLMELPENRKAVEVISKHLVDWQTLDGDYISVLVDVLDDPEATDADWNKYLMFRNWPESRLLTNSR